VGPDLAFALELADAADAISLARFGSSRLRVDTKPDMTPVSEADREVEWELRRLIAERRPGESVLGEEDGGDPDAAWILDPIDATKNYVRGIPLFATLISFDDRAAVVSAPALGRRWWAERASGAFANGVPIGVSAVARVEDAVLTYTGLHGRTDRFLALTDRVWAARGFGDFWQYMLLAEGAVDVCVESVANLWDLAAPKVIIEEAGGTLTDLGGAVTAAGGNALASNGLLHEAVLEALGQDTG
jgi:histidinol-phosphatase